MLFAIVSGGGSTRRSSSSLVLFSALFFFFSLPGGGGFEHKRCADRWYFGYRTVRECAPLFLLPSSSSWQILVCGRHGVRNAAPSQKEEEWGEGERTFSPRRLLLLHLLHSAPQTRPILPSHPLTSFLPRSIASYTWKRGIFGSIKRGIVLHLPGLREWGAGVWRRGGGGRDGGNRGGRRPGTMYFTWKDADRVTAAIATHTNGESTELWAGDR